MQRQTCAMQLGHCEVEAVAELPIPWCNAYETMHDLLRVLAYLIGIIFACQESNSSCFCHLVDTDQHGYNTKSSRCWIACFQDKIHAWPLEHVHACGERLCASEDALRMLRIIVPLSLRSCTLGQPSALYAPDKSTLH
jgi:hypothetical protein